MKKLLIIAFAIALVTGISSMAMAVGNGAGIVGSPHDWSGEAWNPTGEICRVCHVPHDHGLATQYYLNGLLWNHEVSSATYTLYDQAWSATLNGVPTQPDGHSKLCLACHDGTIGIDTFDKYAGGVEFVPGYAKIPGFDDGANKDLRGTHPISIPYDDVNDLQLAVASTTPIGTSGTIEEVLEAGKLQCSGCHDVHDKEAASGTALLRVANTVASGGTASGLCLTCHLK